MFPAACGWLLPGPGTEGTVTVGLSGGARFRTIGEALAHAGPGDTVRVGDGTYREAVKIDNAAQVLIGKIGREVYDHFGGAEKAEKK